MNTNQIKAELIKETEKAVLLEVFTSYKNKNGHTRKVWIPKTHATKINDNFYSLSDWALTTKKHEIALEFCGIAKRVQFVSDNTKSKLVWI